MTTGMKYVGMCQPFSIPNTCIFSFYFETYNLTLFPGSKISVETDHVVSVTDFSY